MATSQAQVRGRHYISGWCSATLHARCKGSYAGSTCSCPCHVPGPASRAAANPGDATTPEAFAVSG